MSHNVIYICAFDHFLKLGLNAGSTSTRPVHSHLTNFDSGVKSHLVIESKKNPDAPDTPAETIKICKMGFKPTFMG